jgi:ribonuclease VapC
VIVIDTSALIAILAQEQAKAELLAKLDAVPVRVISLVTQVESIMVASRMFPDPVAAVSRALRTMNVEAVHVDASQSVWAVHAFLAYGKGRHPARLNIGDCFSYAAAKALNAPLLYVGDDFVKTDIGSA